MTTPTADPQSIYDFTATALDGSDVDFAQFAGKVLLIVNTASKCGLTPQYEGLQSLHQQYAEQGLVVIGFPCNQFGHQEPGDADDIGNFCQKNYGVSFLMMQKIDVNGDHAHPIYQWLKQQQGGFITDAIKWNFSKFLIGRDGQVLHRYAPTTKPEDLTKDIVNALDV